jgi:hypothetical protein
MRRQRCITDLKLRFCIGGGLITANDYTSMTLPADQIGTNVGEHHYSPGRSSLIHDDIPYCQRRFREFCHQVHVVGGSAVLLQLVLLLVVLLLLLDATPGLPKRLKRVLGDCNLCCY